MIKQAYQIAKCKVWKKYLLTLQPLLLFVGLQIAAAIYLYDIIQNTVNFDISGESIRLKDNMDFKEAVITFLCIILLAPITEELLFRGLILNRAIKVMPFYKANLLQAFVFGAIHMGYFKLISGLILGYIQGYLVRKYKSYVVPIMMHIFVNLWPVLYANLFEL